MSKTRCAVIGVGYLGRFHAQKYHQLEQAHLLAVCDHNSDTAQRVAQELQVDAYVDYRDLFGLVDAVSIAATTQSHYEVAKQCLLNGIHVLLEKPMTETIAQAQELIDIAHKQRLKLQIGHIERFNAVRIALNQYLGRPLFIDSQRLSPFTPRGADVNVILDLMIHDIDLIQTMVNSPICSIEAHGSPVLTSQIDIANARIRFENHCVANVVASRISSGTERKMKIFQADKLISLDFHQKNLSVFQKGNEEMFPGIPNIHHQSTDVDQNDAILEEIIAFLACIQHNTPPLVTGEQGRDALATAIRITESIEQNLALHECI